LKSSTARTFEKIRQAAEARILAAWKKARVVADRDHLPFASLAGPAAAEMQTSWPAEFLRAESQL
jgi:hypothetical protein